MDEFLIAFIIILLYLMILFIIKWLGVGCKKTNNISNNYCPDCSLALNRIKRTSKDKTVYFLTFKIFDFKRYLCQQCAWEGLRWEEKYRPRGK